MDSDLLVQQVKGTYRVRAPNLMPFHRKALKAISQFARVNIPPHSTQPEFRVRRTGESSSDLQDSHRPPWRST